MSTNKGRQIGDDILKKVQNHLMSSSVVMLKLWQALQDGESLSEEDIFGCIQRNIVLSRSAFSMLSQFRKNRFKRVLSKDYASVCSEPYRGTEVRPNLQNIYLERICLKKFKKFPKRISCLNKLQNLHLITANLTAVKVFSLFAKAPGFSHNQFLRKPKPGAIPHQGESFSDQSQTEELQIQKRNLPLNRENQILSGKLVQFNLNSDTTVLQTISGLQIPFWSCPKLQKIIPVTLLYSKEEYETLSQEIQSLKDKDAITEIPSTQAKFISRHFTVPKRSRGKRPVINLAPMNNHICNQPFKMEGSENLRYWLNPGDYFVKIDLSDADLSIPVHEDSQPYLAFIFDQVKYAFKTMPFGLNVAPAQFTKFSNQFWQIWGHSLFELSYG